MAWSSLVCWLFVLVCAGSLEPGAPPRAASGLGLARVAGAMLIVEEGVVRELVTGQLHCRRLQSETPQQTWGGVASDSTALFCKGRPGPEGAQGLMVPTQMMPLI